MRTETIINKIYNIDELSQEAFDKARQDYIENEIESGIRNEEFFNNTTDELKYDYDIDAKLQYSFGYCQGDGLSFDCDNLLTDEILKEIEKELTPKDKRILAYINEYGGRFYTKNNNHHYCYASKYDVDYSFAPDDIFDCYKDEHKTTSYTKQDFTKTTEKVLEALCEWYLDKCAELEKRGYDYLYYELTDDEFNDICHAYGYEFYEDGARY